MDININNLDFLTINLTDQSGQTHSFNLKDELRVNEYNLDKEYLEQPSKYVYWASILETLRYYLESAELQVDILKGNLDEEARKSITAEGGKPTKDSVEAYILRHGDYQKALENVKYYEYLVKQMNFVVKAFEQRKDMLIQYGAQLRANQNYSNGAGKVGNFPNA